MNPDIEKTDNGGANARSVESTRLADQKAPARVAGIDSTQRRKSNLTGKSKAENKRTVLDKSTSTDKRKKMKTKKYEKRLRKLQAELCKLQEWVKYKGLRIIIVFEGRDGAGKGGTIRAITERVSPRVFRLVALPA